jgi:Protein of unknown function (DUF2889)
MRSLALEDLPEPPDDSLTGTIDRRPGSVRRTAHINMTWPGGYGSPLQLRGRARDLLTSGQGSPSVVAEAEMVVQVNDQRTIDAISVAPDRDGSQGLIGARGGGRLRSAIDSALPGERQAATPLYFLLDDIAGATLIAGFSWTFMRPTRDGSSAGRARSDGRIICSGLRPGGYRDASRERSVPLPFFLRAAGDLASDDPWAWHSIEPAPDVCLRRRRRIDLWRSSSGIQVDMHFRDSVWDTSHAELALHEYSVAATIEADSHRLGAINVVPRVLPFPECPWAAPHASVLVGQTVGSFRTEVQERLTELRACTHLNDALRGLAEVPALARNLQ